ncbi:hypothetical protein ABT237_22245 [Streptomyces sp. NPDC001581]|uniref:hypothetical protein n=1 Tax=Streptomyces sp. NPDC001581 TaxID=3154386 RepID=UPI00332F821F
MPIPTPFSLAGLIANIEAERGRVIHLVPVPDQLLAGSSLCGLWMKEETGQFDLIFYPKSTSRFHQEKIILHELGHLWCDDADGVTGAEAAELLGDFAPALIERLLMHQRVAARRRYGTHKEVRAEIVADLIHHAAFIPQFHNEPEDPVLRSLAESLTYPTRRRP